MSTYEHLKILAGMIAAYDKIAVPEACQRVQINLSRLCFVVLSPLLRRKGRAQLWKAICRRTCIPFASFPYMAVFSMMHLPGVNDHGHTQKGYETGSQAARHTNAEDGWMPNKKRERKQEGKSTQKR
jgi:hypothetical protein